MSMSDSADDGATAEQESYSAEDMEMAIQETVARTRRSLAKEFNPDQYGGDRNLNEVLGYPEKPTVRDYYRKYKRQDLARTIVDAPPDTCWRDTPEIVDDEDKDEDTEFEADVKKLFNEYDLLHYLERADTVAGIGHYGILFLGLADGVDKDNLNKPVDDGGMDSLEDLNFMTPYSELRVEKVETVTDPTDERNGLPEIYTIDFGGEGKDEDTYDVHWTRVIHVADNLLENEWYGRPRLEAVYNRLEDLEKVVGGAAEMTWRGADRKFVVNADKDMQNIMDKEDLQKSFENMIHDLDSVAYTRGMDVETIAGDVVDPSGLVEQLIKLIAGETGIPQRILTGSERGELASTQDRATFFGRMQERRQQFCEPKLLRPVLDRLIRFGILSSPTPEDSPDGDDPTHDYEVEWDELFELSELEKAELAAQQSRALKDAAPSGDPGQLATVPEIRSQVFGWSEEKGSEAEADAIPDGRREGDVPLEVPETPEERDTFDEIMPPRETPAQPAATDGGEEQ